MIVKENVKITYSSANYVHKDSHINNRCIL